MTLELAQALLSGRRGRRLLWEFACASEEQAASGNQELPLHSGMFHASYQVEVSRGHAVAMYGPGADEGRKIQVGVEALAQLLDASTLAPVTADLVQTALRLSVDAARYWQEPDGEDTLLASAQLAAALERVARHLAAAELKESWFASMGRTSQHHVDFEQHDPHDSRQSPAGKARELLEAGREHLLETEAHRARQDAASALGSFSGEWWSMPSYHLISTTGVFSNQEPVGLSCVEDGFGWEQASVRAVSIPPAVRVYEIAAAEDWIQLCQKYGIEVTAQKRHDWYLSTGRDGAWKIPDWSAVANDFDGVHLCFAGYLALAGECIDVDDTYASVIAGWDPDRTYWFTDDLRFYSATQIWQCQDASNDDSRWALAVEPQGS